jgi:hypothetical protein
VTDPVLTFVLIAAEFMALLAVRFFKTLESASWNAWGTPIVAGLVGGLVIRFTSDAPVVIGVVLTLSALYVRLTGHENEPIDGMLLGAASGAAAAIPLVIHNDAACRTLAECLIAGGATGFGTTFAAFQVTDKTRRAMIDVITAVVAIGLAYGAHFIRDDRATAIAVVIAVPLIAIATLFQQWADVRAELGHEASLGFIKDSDVRRTAHPLLRLGSGGWADRKAHREFVRLANKVALRKRQQRSRPDEIARLYQVEIIKLRMQIQEMSKIDRDVISASRSGEVPSDTMARSK